MMAYSSPLDLASLLQVLNLERLIVGGHSMGADTTLHFAAAKLIALYAGYICQNLYIAAGAIGVSSCSVNAYDQTKMNEFLEVNGNDEFLIYLTPVGKISTRLFA
jgi:nitroreductase